MSRRGPELLRISRALSAAVDTLEFQPPVEFVYNPLAYARAPHEAYLRRFGASPKEAILLGMNPGPFGMVQTGIPFGDVEFVRRWMGIEARVGRPEREHPRRPIEGFASKRSEVSGSRLWGWAESRFGTAERFFERFFVINYCPLAFLEEGGRNRTPDKLPKAERAPLEAACDRALRASIELLEPAWVIGVGAFARKRAEQALGGLELRFGTILHPSPASPLANRGWAPQIEAQLEAMGIALP
ncbi:MAG: single-stranded DNA-binding protein [Myxococcales bacterium]|nr:single-stranded DNA-binding protein [Myxococcales bacterium]